MAMTTNTDENLATATRMGEDTVLYSKTYRRTAREAFVALVAIHVPAADRPAMIAAFDTAGEFVCEGHESLAGEHMGETVFCNGSCTH